MENNIELPMTSLGFLLDRALWTLTNSLNTALRESGIDLPHSQYIVMRVLFEHEGVSQKEIAVYLHKDTAAIKRSIDYLEKKNFVIRKNVSGKMYGIYLSDYGKQMKQRIIAIADAVVNKVLMDIPPEKSQCCMEFLGMVCTKQV